VTLAPPVREQTGRVVSVYEVRAGAALAADVAALATVLTLDEVEDFAEEGGLLSIASATDADVNTEPIPYTAIDRDSATITLGVPIPSEWGPFVAGDLCWVSPPATERRADVALDGETDQVVPARIPFVLSNQLAAGVRPDQQGEWVRVTVDPYGYTLVDVEYEYATVDPASVEIVDPDTGEVTGELGADAAFNSVTADVISSPSVPLRNAEDLLLYVDPTTGSDDNDGTALPPMLDTFERVVASGWGTSDSGHVWTQVVNQGPSPPDVGVANPGMARLRVNGPDQKDIMRSSFAVLDAEASGRIALGGVPGGGSVDFGLAAHVVGSNDMWALGLNVGSTARIQIVILRLSGGSWTYLHQVEIAPAGSYVGGQVWQVRGQVQTNPDGGTDLRLKVWLDGGTEPDDWMAAVNDATATNGLNTPGGFGAFMRSGSGFLGATIGYQLHDCAFACIDSGGNIIDTTEGAVGPLATVSEALDRVGDWNDGEVRVVLSGTLTETIELNGLVGGGRLIIDGAGVAVLEGFVKLYGVHQYMELRDFTLQDLGDAGVGGSIDMRTTRHVEVLNVKVQSNGARANNIQVAEGSEARVDGCQLSGATTNCIQLIEGSMCYANDNKGTGGSTSSYRSANSIMFVSGTKPTGATATGSGGQIFGSTSSNDGGTAPPPSAKKTTTHTVSATKTWRPQWGWKDGDDTIQGEWQGSGGLSRGCAFYGSKLRKPGKTADKGQVYIHRRNTGGSSGKESIFLATHPHETRPGGGPAIGNGPVKIGELAWGQGRWFNIPAGWVQDLITGGQRGLMVYHGSASPYVIASGRSDGASMWKVKITSH
jgi:hypothetical protein